MNQHILALCLVLSACGTDVPLELTPEGPSRPPDGSGAPSSPEDPGTGSPDDPLALPAWSISNLPDSHIERLAWTPEGDLVVSVLVRGVAGDRQVATSSLRRFDRDGAPRWVNELPVLQDGGGRYTAFDAAADGGVQAAVSFEADRPDTGSPARPAELRSLDRDGSVTRSIALTGSSPADDDDVVLVNSVVALPDGGVALAGVTGAASGPAFVARLDADGATIWNVPIEWWSPDTIGEDVPQAREAATDLTLTADGALVVRGSYFADVIVGDRAASTPAGQESTGGIYVARIDVDGSVSWLQTILDGAIPNSGYTSGMAVASDGRVIVAGMVSGLAQVGDLELEVEGNNRHYAAELDVDGDPLSLVELQYPEGIDWGYVGQTMALRGDQLILGGQETILSDDAPLFGARILVVAYDGDGAVQSTLSTRIEGEPASADGFTYDAAVSADGRLALGGNFAGWADFGQGPVVTQEDGDGFYPFEPSAFVAVYDPLTPVD